MHYYRKGVRAEYEWLKFLIYKGFATVRAPSSGSKDSPIDIVAMKKGLILAFEIKNHKKMPKLSKDRLNMLNGWCARAGAIGLLAWRNKGQWLFLTTKDAAEKRYEPENWLDIERLLQALDFNNI